MTLSRPTAHAGRAALKRWVRTMGSQVKAARVLGVHTSTVQLLCAGKRNPSWTMAKRIARRSFGAVPAKLWEPKS